MPWTDEYIDKARDRYETNPEMMKLFIIGLHKPEHCYEDGFDTGLLRPFEQPSIFAMCDMIEEGKDELDCAILFHRCPEQCKVIYDELMAGKRDSERDNPLADSFLWDMLTVQRDE